MTSMSVLSKSTFVGQRLQLAREFRDLTQKQLGEKVAASHALVSLCESGKRTDPATDLVEAFGTVLGFDAQFFYEPDGDIFREEECSFRHRRSTPERLKTKIRANASLLGMVLERLRRHFKFPSLNIPKMPASTDPGIEKAAEQARQHWALGIDAPISDIGRVMEHAGVFLVSHLAESSQVDAFSRDGSTAIIFLNQGVQSTSRWVFDVGHECGHLVMHSGIQTGTEETEDAADKFAGAFLLPRVGFAREFRTSPFSFNHVFKLKKRWKASAAAIIKRAYDLKLIDAVQYRQSFKYMSARGWRKGGEPNEPDFKGPELLPTALGALGTKVHLTVDQLCRDLDFTPETFLTVTAVSVPLSKGKLVEVIPIRATGLG
jgi:Zn-dependent peptidase ImmA (M78 family)/transcriptional regulator with XRE-family HTH domain